MAAPASESWYPEDPSACLQLANIMVVLHFAVALYIILGQVVILLGPVFRIGFVRLRSFRLSHLLAIAIVAGIASLGSVCPLTVWENELRELGGQPIEQESFIAYWAHELLYIDIPIHTLRWWYLGFGLLVVASLFLVPVDWKNTRSERLES